jgi:multiple sugar transport system permease protein
VLGLLLVLVLFPFYWMTITSFKTEDQMRSLVSMFWPSPFVVENYTQLLTRTDFGVWYRNSAAVAISSTLVATAIGTIGAYALARLRFLGRAFLSSAILITYLVPPSILFIPLYAQIRTMGLADSLAGLIAAYPSFTVPFVTWLLMGYFGSIPEELEEAAMIDGATRFGAFRRIILPLAAPGVLAVSGAEPSVDQSRCGLEGQELPRRGVYVSYAPPTISRLSYTGPAVHRSRQRAHAVSAASSFKNSP